MTENSADIYDLINYLIRDHDNDEKKDDIRIYSIIVPRNIFVQDNDSGSADNISDLQAIMGIIDDNKQNIDNGDYLKLSNILKQMFNRINDTKDSPTPPAAPPPTNQFEPRLNNPMVRWLYQLNILPLTVAISLLVKCFNSNTASAMLAMYIYQALNYLYTSIPLSIKSMIYFLFMGSVYEISNLISKSTYVMNTLLTMFFIFIVISFTIFTFTHIVVKNIVTVIYNEVRNLVCLLQYIYLHIIFAYIYAFKYILKTHLMPHNNITECIDYILQGHVD